jgi:hypothetical protein
VDLALFDATSQAGSSFTTSNGAWSSFNGSVGPTASNKVLIAQITTDGVFHYELNIQLQDANGNAEKYVVANPQGTERTIPSLVGTLGGVNALPVVNITSPASPATATIGQVVTITATATDPTVGGSITKVEFFDGLTLLGTDNTGPSYTYDYTSVAGVHSITAVATDNEGGVATSAPLALTVSADPYPTVSITATLPVFPATSVITKQGVAVPFTATASDNGSVAQVEFFAGTTSFGVDNTGPSYTASFPVAAVGTFLITAKATDNLGQTTTSAPVSVRVNANVAPTVSITAPVSGANVNVGTAVTLTANVGDSDGTVASVVFKADGVVVPGTLVSGVYSAPWTAPATEKVVVIEATVTDDNGATTTATVSVNVVDPALAKPYEFRRVRQSCNEYAVWMPVFSTRTTMDNVIGYDMALKYDPLKVTPTGLIIVSNLTDSTKTAYVTNIEAAAGIMNITIFFTDGTERKFSGAGQLFRAEFTRKPAFQSNDSTVFSMNSFVESYKTTTLSKEVKPDKYVSYKDNMFSGSLKFWKDDSPIVYNGNPNEYLITDIIGSLNPAVAVQPDMDGKFQYNVLNGTSIAIKRDINNTTDVHPVIMAADALAAAYIANKNAAGFTPTIFNMIAADVNLDGKVSAGDASQINFHAVNPGEFSQAGTLPGAPSKDWLFVSSVTLAGAAYKISATYPEDDTKGFSRNRVPVVSFLQALPNNDYENCVKIGSDVYTGIMWVMLTETMQQFPRMVY